MFKEFRTFVMRGNVVDLAVGVIIGASFTGIVNSLVKDVLMPPVGLLLGGIDFSNFYVVLKGNHAAYPSLKAATDAGAVTLNYGLFINTILNFLIVAFVLFPLLRQINRLKSPPPDAPPAEVPQDVQLLREIRDALVTAKPSPTN
jgi:large conductance mechanosensitive channel